MKKKYVVEVCIGEDPFCLLETHSVNQACNFLETIDFRSDDVRVSFFRENPFFKYDVKSILEVLQ